MLERQTLGALYVAAGAGFQQAAGSEVARVDPLLRGAVRRRLQQAVDRGVDLTGPQTDALDEGHQLRVAYLLAAGKLGSIDVKSRDAVSVAFDAVKRTPPPRASRLWLVTPLVLCCVLGGGSFAAWQLFRPSPEAALRASTLGRALGKDLTEWVVALDRMKRARAADDEHKLPDASTRMTKARDALLGSTKGALGEAGERAIQEVLDLEEGIEGSMRPEGIEGTPEDEQKLYDAVKRFDDLVSSHPVLLDAAVQGKDYREVWLFAFYLQRQVKVRDRGTEVRVALARRLDNLNLTVNAESYESKPTGVLIVSLDLIEENVLRGLLKALTAGSPWPILPEDVVRDLDGAAPMLRRAGEVAREELLPASGVATEAIVAVLQLLDRRNELVPRIKTERFELNEPRLLLLDVTTVERLEGIRKENLDVQQILEVDEKLRAHADDVRRIVEVLAKGAAVRGPLFAAERKRKDDAALPEPVAAAMVRGGEREPNKNSIAWADFVANLGALATDKELARTQLAVIAADALTSWRRRATRGAARALLEAVAKELGQDTAALEALDARGIPKLYGDIAAKPTEEVRAAAERAYGAFVGEPPALEWKE
jgi:hypothetical protein